MPCLAFILLVLHLVLLHIFLHVFVLCLFCIVGPFLPQVHCCWFLLFSIQFALLQIIVRLGFYCSLPALHYYYSFFTFIVAIHWLPSLLLFIVHPGCYCLPCVTIVRFGSLLLALGCYCLPCATNVHFSFCVTTTCLGTHLTFPCVIIACTSPYFAINYYLLYVDPIIYWGVVLPPPLVLSCVSWTLEREVKKRGKK